jgi:hypothetical protein
VSQAINLELNTKIHGEKNTKPKPTKLISNLAMNSQRNNSLNPSKIQPKILTIISKISFMRFSSTTIIITQK